MNRGRRKKAKFHWTMAGKRKIKFCNDCGEYVDSEGYCSNPWCPEEMEA
jgi:hypothetical protein